MTDIETGQSGPMPICIAKAIIAVMRGVKQLGFDERNEHGHYSYVSIDKFLAAIRPLCAEAGIFILLEEVEIEVKARSGGGDGAGTSYLFPRYEVWLGHESGEMWGPLHRRLALPATGPQAFGSAESYVLKRIMRNLFLVPTGDKDADEVKEGEIPETGHRERRLQSAPEVKGKPEAIAAYKRIRSDILACKTVPEIDEIMTGEVWSRMILLVKSVNPDGVDNSIAELQRLAARHAAALRGALQEVAE